MADLGIFEMLLFRSSEVRRELSSCGRICGDSLKQKIEKQNKLGAKFTDNKNTKLMKKIRVRSYRNFGLCS